ncbi:MAG: hypothetical protein U1F43_31210 [Myxococcota bacterium]
MAPDARGRHLEAAQEALARWLDDDGGLDRRVSEAHDVELRDQPRHLHGSAKVSARTPSMPGVRAPP